MNPTLRWRTVGDAPGPWAALQPASGVNSGFRELGAYTFEKVPGLSLRVDDEDLPTGPDGHWLWEPGFFAGEVTAELVGATKAERTLYLLDVAPDPSKLGKEMFAQMVRELLQEAPELLVGTEPATTLVGDLGAFQNPWLAFARLRQYLPPFLQTLVALCANPRRNLHARRATLPLHQARTVDVSTLSTTIRSPAAVWLVDSVHADRTDCAEFRLNVPVVEETVDCAANRAMLALLMALTRRSASVLERLQAFVDREADSSTRTSLKGRWPHRRQILEDGIARLKSFLRRPPFSKVQRPEVTAAGLTAIAADPTYARAWGLGWSAMRPGLESGESLERFWVSPSWGIYEAWCFLALGKAVAASAPEWQWGRRTDRWVGTSANRRAMLRMQPKFASSEAEVKGRWSVSKERVPDFLLQVESSDEFRFVLLDAKYRTSRANVLDAMESAHIYRDSLRIGSRRADGALLLIPAGGGAPWLEAPEFHERHRVGVSVLSPGETAALPAMVVQLLSAPA